jgi:hypothetical protein
MFVFKFIIPKEGQPITAPTKKVGVGGLDKYASYKQLFCLNTIPTRLTAVSIKLFVVMKGVTVTAK